MFAAQLALSGGSPRGGSGGSGPLTQQPAVFERLPQGRRRGRDRESTNASSDAHYLCFPFICCSIPDAQSSDVLTHLDQTTSALLLFLML